MKTDCQKALKATANISLVDERIEKINKALKAYGVESITSHSEWSRYYGNIVALYVNMGDSYECTVIYDVKKGKFIVSSYGDWVEKNQKKYSLS